MSNIQDLLAQILAARYGRDVRQSIHDAIETCYEDGHAGAIDLQAREDISALDGRMDTAEGNITALQSGKVTDLGEITVPSSVTNEETMIHDAMVQVFSEIETNQSVVFYINWEGNREYKCDAFKLSEEQMYFEINQPAQSHLWFGRLRNGVILLNEVQTKIKTKTYTGTTDQYGRITTDLSLTNVAMVNVISNSAGHICEQYFSNTGNLGIKVLNSVDMNAVTNTSVTLTIRYASV